MNDKDKAQAVKPTDEFLRGWIASDSTREDVIVLRRVFVDICGGNIIDGVMLAQLVYWHTPRKGGGTRLQIERTDTDGCVYYWLAKNYSDWWQECRVPEGTARDSIKRLCELGIITKQIWFFEGRKMPHLRLMPEQFRLLVEAAQNGTVEELRTSILNDGNRILLHESKRREPTDVNDGSQQIQTTGANGYSHIYIRNTEITPEIVSETTSSTALGIDQGHTPIDDDDWQFIQAEVDKLGLSGSALERLKALDPLSALALIRQAVGQAKTNPAGLLLTILEQPPQEKYLTRARIVLETARQLHDLDRLASQEPDAEDTPPAAIDPPAPPAVSIAQDGDGLNYRPGDGALSMREAWCAVLGQLQAQLERQEFEMWLAGSEPVGYANGVLRVRVRHIYGPSYIERRLGNVINQVLRSIAQEPISAVFVSRHTRALLTAEMKVR